MQSVISSNLYLVPEAVGGNLHLEQTQLAFRSHAPNIQTGTTTIPYATLPTSP